MSPGRVPFEHGQSATSALGLRVSRHDRVLRRRLRERKQDGRNEPRGRRRGRWGRQRRIAAPRWIEQQRGRQRQRRQRLEQRRRRRQRLEQQRRRQRCERLERRRHRGRDGGRWLRSRVQRRPGRARWRLQGLSHVPRRPSDQYGHRHAPRELALGRLARELLARARVPAARPQHAVQHRGREYPSGHRDELRLQLEALSQPVAVPGQRGHRRGLSDHQRRPPLPRLRRRRLQALRGLQHPLGLGDDHVHGGLGHRLGHDD